MSTLQERTILYGHQVGEICNGAPVADEPKRLAVFLLFFQYVFEDGVELEELVLVVFECFGDALVAGAAEGEVEQLGE